MTLTHSEAHEQLADLALEPAALASLARAVGAVGADPDAASAAEPLAAHVRACADCRAELETWQRLHGTVHAALDGPSGALRLADLASERPLVAPPSLRAAVAAIAQERRPVASGGSPAAGEPASLAAAPSRRGIVRRFGSWMLPIAAVLAIVILSGGLLVDQSRRLDQAKADTAALASVTASLDRVILDPAHRAVALTAADGTTAGSVVWSSHDLVVLTTALAKPPADSVYKCWIERDGTRSPIGRMFFADGTGYWTGSLDAWATTSFAAGSTFGISLEPLAGSTGSPAVLQAALGG